jgi:hypothetical protein
MLSSPTSTEEVGAAMKLAGLFEKKRKRTRKAAAPSAQEAVLLEQYRRGLAADAYVDWLVRMIGGWLEPGHGNLVSFLYAAQHLPVTGAVIEVGSFLGASTNILAYLLHRHAGRRPLFNCDPWCFEGTEEPIGGVFDAARPEWRAYARDGFLRNTRLFSAPHLPHSFELGSDEFFALWRRGAETEDLFGRRVALGGPIAFAYVDGNHSYEQARKDVDNVRADLVPGGLLLLDDSADNSPFECRHVVGELLAQGFTAVWKNPNYLLRAAGA